MRKRSKRAMLTVCGVVLSYLILAGAVGLPFDPVYLYHQIQASARLREACRDVRKATVFQTRDISLAKDVLWAVPHGSISPDALVEVMQSSRFEWFRHGIYEGWGYVIELEHSSGRTERMTLWPGGAFHFPRSTGFFVLAEDQRTDALRNEIAEVVRREFEGGRVNW